MTFKACKYCQVTQIQWDNDDSLFKESDGRAHDRTRCESIRNKTGKSNGGSSSSASSPQQTEQQTSTVRTDVWLIPKDDWDKLISNSSNIIMQLNKLSEYYGDLLEHLKSPSIQTQLRAIAEGQEELGRMLQSIIFRDYDKKEQAKADAEARYDTDRENGFDSSLGNTAS